MNNDPLGPKDPQEIKLIKFAFARELGGATAATATATASTHKGVDASPAGVILGAPSIVGTDVYVRMQAGLDGVVYKLRVVVTDTAGNVHVATELVAVQTL
ncbi:MAG: hypothetical protein IPN53_05185 [Comamonadaceae bacterium]|nr:hypothetical protein [Comamonadaceae bacterium]